MHRLPALAFGNAVALATPDSRVAAETWAAMVPSLCTLEVDRSSPFAAKVVARQVGELGLVTTAVSPSKIRIDDSQGWQLLIPFFGRGHTKFGQTTLPFEGGRSGMLLPNVRRTTENTAQMIVAARIDIAKLRAIAGVIVGDEAGRDLIGDRAHAIEMRRQRELFPAFQHLCSLIDATSGNPDYARILGIEDMMYRWTVHALGILPADSGKAPIEATDHSRLDVVCDLVRTAHERPVTLTEMEAISGLSARALQYGFKARFGCSPMEWQRRERMQHARRRLLLATPDETVTSVAYAMGFCSSAAFSTQYRRYFGETPSQTQRLRS